MSFCSSFLDDFGDRPSFHFRCILSIRSSPSLFFINTPLTEFDHIFDNPLAFLSFFPFVLSCMKIRFWFWALAAVSLNNWILFYYPFPMQSLCFSNSHSSTSNNTVPTLPRRSTLFNIPPLLVVHLRYRSVLFLSLSFFLIDFIQKSSFFLS